MQTPTVTTRFLEVQALAYAGAGLAERGDDLARQQARRLARLITRESVALTHALRADTDKRAA